MSDRRKEGYKGLIADGLLKIANTLGLEEGDFLGADGLTYARDYTFAEIAGDVVKLGKSAENFSDRMECMVQGFRRIANQLGLEKSVSLHVRDKNLGDYNIDHAIEDVATLAGQTLAVNYDMQVLRRENAWSAEDQNYRVIAADVASFADRLGLEADCVLHAREVGNGFYNAKQLREDLETLATHYFAKIFDIEVESNKIGAPPGDREVNYLRKRVKDLEKERDALLETSKGDEYWEQIHSEGDVNFDDR
jgi:hypothetical protein